MKAQSSLSLILISLSSFGIWGEFLCRTNIHDPFWAGFNFSESQFFQTLSFDRVHHAIPVPGTTVSRPHECSHQASPRPKFGNVKNEQSYQFVQKWKLFERCNRYLFFNRLFLSQYRSIKKWKGWTCKRAKKESDTYDSEAMKYFKLSQTVVILI